MKREEIKSSLTKIMHKHFTHCKNISESDNLFTDHGYDSVDFIEFIMHIEVELGISIDDFEVDSIETFGEVIEVTERILNQLKK